MQFFPWKKKKSVQDIPRNNDETASCRNCSVENVDNIIRFHQQRLALCLDLCTIGVSLIVPLKKGKNNIALFV